MVDQVVRIHGARFAKALDLFQSEFDLGLSFTDWTSVVVMKDTNIDVIATFDRDLRKVVHPVAGL